MQVKKICMIGDFGVGKTSLVKQFVHSEFSDKYLTTVGVKIDTKLLTLSSGDQLKLILWDIEGTNKLSTIDTNYLRGASGYFIVVDGTRKSTVETAISLNTQAEQIIGSLPFVLLLNKVDMKEKWQIDKETILNLKERNFIMRQTSAKNGTGIEAAFQTLGERLIK
jgi:hypothetical protein